MMDEDDGDMMDMDDEAPSEFRKMIRVKSVLFVIPESTFKKSIKPIVLLIGIGSFILIGVAILCFIFCFVDMFIGTFLMPIFNIFYDVMLVIMLIIIGLICISIYRNRNSENTAAKQRRGCWFIALTTISIIVGLCMLLFNFILAVTRNGEAKTDPNALPASTSGVSRRTNGDDDSGAGYANPENPYVYKLTFTVFIGTLGLFFLICCCLLSCLAGVINYQIEGNKRDAIDCLTLWKTCFEDIGGRFTGGKGSDEGSTDREGNHHKKRRKNRKRRHRSSKPIKLTRPMADSDDDDSDDEDDEAYERRRKERAKMRKKKKREREKKEQERERKRRKKKKERERRKKMEAEMDGYKDDFSDSDDDEVDEERDEYDSPKNHQKKDEEKNAFEEYEEVDDDSDE